MHWAQVVQREKISTAIYVKCDNKYLSKVCCPEFLYILSSHEIQLEQYENDYSESKKKKFKAVKYD